MLQTFSLKNGVRVATYSIPQMRSVHISETVKGGSIFDNEKNSGTAHFMEHILVEGTPSYPTVEQLSDFVEGLAGRYGASTGSLTINFNANAPAKRLEDLVKLASEVFFEPLFTETSVEKERNAVLEEIKGRQDQLWYKNSKFFFKTRFNKNHPYQLDGGGSQEAVNKLSKADLVAYWQRFFLPKNTHVVITGGFKDEEAKKLLEKYFGKYQVKSSFEGFPNLSNKDMLPGQVAIRNDPQLKTCYVSLSFPSTNANHPTQLTVNQTIIKSILGGLRRSRLFRLLRQKRGLVYDVGVGSSSAYGFGYAYASFEATPENLDEVLELLCKEIGAFIKNGPTEEELAFSKNYHVNRVLMSWDHPGSIADWIEGDLLWEDKIWTPEEYAEVIGKVTHKSLMAFMKKYWELDKLTLVVQGPISDSKANREKYRGYLQNIK